MADRPLTPGDRQKDPDADAKGAPVLMADGAVWYVRAMVFGERGGIIAKGQDEMDRAVARLAAEERRVGLCTEALESAPLEGIDAATAALEAAMGRQAKALGAVEELQSHIALHAIRQLYDVTPEESDALVGTRQWGEIQRALAGEDTEKSEEQRAIDLLRAMEAAKRGGDPAAPLVDSTSGSGVEAC